MLPPILVELKANSREFVAGMKTAQHEVQKLGTEGSSHMQKFAAVGKAALFGVGAVALTVGGFSVEMADKFEASHAKLVAALKGSGTSFDAWKGQIAAADSRMEKLGFTNTQTQDALGGLVIALQDPAKALKVMATAADLARAKNIDLSTAGTMVARAMEGNSRALKQMGIDLPINAKSAENLKVAQNNLRFATEAYNTQLLRIHEKHKVTAADLATLKTAHDRLTFAQQQVNQAQQAGTLILDALNQRLGGQSQQYTESFAGKVTVLKTQMEDLGVKIGLALIPILEKLGNVIGGVVGWFEKHTAIAKVLGVAVGTVLVVAIAAYTVSMITAAAATIAATWPILAIIAAVALVGVGIYELATHWHQVWGAISSFTSRVGHQILHVLETWGPLALAVLMPFLGIPLLIWQHFSAIKGFMSRAFDAAVGAVKTGVGDIVGFVKKIPGMIITAFGDYDNLLLDVGKRIIGGLVHGITGAAGSVKNSLVDLTKKIVSWKGPPDKDSTLLTPAGRKIIEGLIAGMVGKRASLQAELASITNLIHTGLTKGFSGAAEKLRLSLPAALAKALAAVSVQAQKSMAALSDKLRASQDKLAADLQARTQAVSGIASTILGGSALSGAFDSSTGVLGSITGYLQTKLTGSQTELSDILGLKSAGLNASTLNELAGMSPDQEMAVAGQLRQPGQVAQTNSLEAQLESTANKIGQAVADATYAKTIAADQKQVADQLKEQKKQTALLEYLARHLGIDIAKALTSPAGAKALRDALTRLGKTGTNLGLA